MSMHVVEVNEVILFTYSTKEVAHRWAMFRQHGTPERFIDTVHSIAGNRVEVLCYDREHAKWLAQHIVKDWGAPPSAVKVKGIAVSGQPGNQTEADHG